MPVSHICLTVSHLPTSCSFYLAALSPLGYNYIGQQDNQVGFGIVQADFFISQAPAGVQPGAAHIAFSAQSRNAVDAFFGAALKAGGRDSGEPTVHDWATGYYSATILDLDSNSVEVVYRDVDHSRNEIPASVASARPEGSRVLTWQKDVAKSTVSDNRSTVSRTALRPIVNISSPTVVVSHPAPERKVGGDVNSKQLVGTLLGAAAGAALAYVMTTGEAQSEQAQQQQPQQTSTSIDMLKTVFRAIEASPLNKSSTSTASAKPNQPPPESTFSAQQYQPPYASSNAPSTLSPRSQHAPSQLLAIEAPRSLTARSTLIDTFIPPTEIPRYTYHQVPQSQSQAQSARPHIARSNTEIGPGPAGSPSRRSLTRSHTSSAAKTITQADFPPKSTHSHSNSEAASLKPDSVVAGSRHGGSHVSKHSVAKSHHTVVAADIPLPPTATPSLCSVSPEDSISQAGSSRSRRSHHRSKREGGGSKHQGSRRTSSRLGEGEERTVVSLPVREKEGGKGREGGLRSVVSQVLGL
ncbi:MAG: hypothetical protein Q9187_006097 [Circinaria calcarea]